MECKVKIDHAKVAAKLGKHIDEKQRTLDIQVAKDCYKFVPVRDFYLRNSVQKSNFGKGVIKWLIAYARRMYYGVNYHFSDPQATHHWFEKAKSLYKKDWIKLVNKK